MNCREECNSIREIKLKMGSVSTKVDEMHSCLVGNTSDASNLGLKSMVHGNKKQLKVQAKIFWLSFSGVILALATIAIRMFLGA